MFWIDNLIMLILPLKYFFVKTRQSGCTFVPDSKHRTIQKQ